MKSKISAVLMLSLMLSMIFMPLTVAADGGKSIVKEMVQAPVDYSFVFIPSDYTFNGALLGRLLQPGYYDIYDRMYVYSPADLVFLRLSLFWF